MCPDIFHKVGLFFRPLWGATGKDRGGDDWCCLYDVYVLPRLVSSPPMRTRCIPATFRFLIILRGRWVSNLWVWIPFAIPLGAVPSWRVEENEPHTSFTFALLCQNVVSLKNGNARWINNSNINIHTSRQPSSTKTGHNNRPYTPFP